MKCINHFLVDMANTRCFIFLYIYYKNSRLTQRLLFLNYRLGEILDLLNFRLTPSTVLNGVALVLFTNFRIYFSGIHSLSNNIPVNIFRKMTYNHLSYVDRYP